MAELRSPRKDRPTMLIAIPLYDRFTALDAVGPYEVLSRLPGAEVVFCAATARPYRTETKALAITADRAIADIDGCDVLVVPGGYGTRQAIDDGSLVDWIRRMHDTTTWTTSVCTGSLLLGAAGLLRGLKATTHWAYYDELARFGAEPTEQRVVEQGKIVTAAGVSSGIDMGLTLAARIAGDEIAKAIQLGIEYDPQPPFDSGAPSKAAPETVNLLRTVLAGAR
jgi:putative intracellular protease/amidase